MTTIADPPEEGARDVTIYDVAERAGVSISTVSLTLNQPAKVAAGTRERVLQAIDDLRFVPKETAVVRARRSLARIGVVAPFSSYSSYAERLNGVLEVARNHDIEVVLFDEESAAATTSPLLGSLPVTGRLDGLIVMSLPLSDEATDRVVRARLPMVLVDIVHPSFTSVVTDDEAGGHLAGARLLLGDKPRIAFVSEEVLSLDFELQGFRRLAGFRRALVEHGVDPDRLEHITTSNDFDGGRDAGARLFDASDEPIAVFAHHDLFAAGVLHEARVRGLDVPSQVAVVGFDDGDVARSLGLTTIAQPFRESGRVAARALVAAVNGDDDEGIRKIELGLRLVVRDTA
jgi:LacI family transcriptional regulator